MANTKIDTWMPLYIGEYLADTMHLTAEEHGAYLLLLMHYWRNGGPIQNDVNGLQIIARIKPSRVSGNTLRTVLAFFEERDGMLHHAWTDQQLAQAVEKTAKRRHQTESARRA